MAKVRAGRRLVMTVRTHEYPRGLGVHYTVDELREGRYGSVVSGTFYCEGDSEPRDDEELVSLLLQCALASAYDR